MFASLLGGAAAAFGGGLFSRFGGKVTDKIFGIPTPKTGQESGQEQYNYDQARFPGTSAWERLGSNPGFAGQQVAAIQKSNIKAQIQGQKDVANIHAGAAVKTAKISRGVGDPISKSKIAHETAQARIYPHQERKLETEIKNLDVQRKLLIQQELTEIRKTELVDAEGKIALSKSILIKIEADYPNLYHWLKVADMGATAGGKIIGSLNISSITNLVRRALRGSGKK